LAVKQRRRRRTGSGDVPASRDRYSIIVNGARREAKAHLPQLALYEAQWEAEHADKELNIEVTRQPLLGGQEHVAYRVIRDECGVVLTYTEED
jgi:hypothetical protein